MTDLGHYDFDDFDKLVKDVADLKRRVKGLEWLARGDGAEDESQRVAALVAENDAAARIFQAIVDAGMSQARFHDILDWLNGRNKRVSR